MKDNLGDRMKGYEGAASIYLSKKTPVIIRIDGKAFHTFTRKMERPFDQRLIDCMLHTTKELVANISGCLYGYVQSDEISLFLTDYKSIKTEAWFQYKKSKLESLTASLATGYFNDIFKKKFTEDEWQNKIAFFDSRAFSLPREEVANYFKWRQLDCERNSIQMLGRAYFSHKQLMHKSCNNIQELLFTEKGINWNDIEVYKKRGVGVYKVGENERTKVFIDLNIPIFNYQYFDKWVYLDRVVLD